MRPETRRAIVTIAERMNRSGIAYQVGGAALLAANDFDVDVDAIDLVFPPAARNELARLLQDVTGVPVSFDGGDDPLFAPAWRCLHHWGTETLDCQGGLAVVIGGDSVRLPFRSGRIWHLDGIEIPLAPAEQWMFVYRILDPRTAAELRERVVTDEGLEALRTDLGLADDVVA